MLRTKFCSAFLTTLLICSVIAVTPLRKEVLGGEVNIRADTAQIITVKDGKTNGRNGHEAEVKSNTATIDGGELQVGAHLDVSDFEPGVLENRVRIERQSPIGAEDLKGETTEEPVEKVTTLPRELVKEDNVLPLDSEPAVVEIAEDSTDANFKEEISSPETKPSVEPESISEPEPSSALEANSEIEANSEPEPTSEPEPSSEPEPILDADFELAPELANHKLDNSEKESNATVVADLETDSFQTESPEVNEDKIRINDKDIKLETLIESFNSVKPLREANETPASINENSAVEPTISADEEYVDYESGVTEHYSDYPEEPEKEKKLIAPTEPPKKAPTLSLKELLLGIRNSNDYEEDSLAAILPDPITGTSVDKVEPPETFLDQVVSSAPVETDFPSYDINVGASVMTGHGDPENGPVGVGQIFAVDIEEPERDEEVVVKDNRPLKPNSFFDSFLNLFGGSPKEPPPPKFKTNMLPPKHVAPPPFVGMRPPPPPPPFHVTTDNDNIFNTEVDETKNEFENEVVDLVARPSIDNEVRSDSIAPTGSLTRSDLPIIRRPTENGGRPLRPGLFAARPNGLLPRPLSSFTSHPTLSEDNLEDVRPNQINPESSFPNLPSDPVIEGGFLAIKSSANATIEMNEDEESLEPTLPPSLPNLQIIPFVAADAVVNQEGFNPEDFRSTPKPLNHIQNTQTCREGGKVWKNGEIVARGDNDPCILCRCHAGKVVCQRRVCPKIPEGCEADSSPAEGECCPKIQCDKSANVSIIDTLPSYQPLDKIETPLNKPNRPSIFSFGQNRRPPFGSPPVDRVPLRNVATDQDKTEGVTAGLRRPVLPPRLKPTTKPLNVSDIILTVDEAEEEKEEPRRPVRPSRPASARPKPDGPTSARPPFSRPFVGGNRTRPGGTRPPFIPPRHKFTHKPLNEHTIQESLTTTSSLDTEIIEPQAEKEESFSNLQPISFHDPIQPPKAIVTESPEIIPEEEKESKPIVESDDNTFIPPPGFLLPRPLSTSRPVNDDDILNFVLQDKFRIPQGNDKFKLSSNRPSSNVLFNVDSRPTKAPPLPVKPQVQQLPEIPESVKAQSPLGNDPILALGLLELGGCNVYGRMYDVGQVIKELSAQCKACQCTKVGVQCLPTC